MIDSKTRRKMNQIEKGILILGNDPSDLIFDGLAKSAKCLFSSGESRNPGISKTSGPRLPPG
jgi:hypothetical protein